MEFINVFSILDFLAYLFPGILDTIGIYLLLLLTPLKSEIQISLDNIGTWIFLILLSYIIGVMIATITDRILRGKDPKTSTGIKDVIHIYDDDLKNEITSAFANYVFEGKRKFKEDTGKEVNKEGGEKEETNKEGTENPKNIEDEDGLDWTKWHYYTCRSAVLEFMPGAAANAFRESAYRQFRMNLIGSLVILMITGIIWGVVIILSTIDLSIVKFVGLTSEVEYGLVFGIILIILSIALVVLMIFLNNRMKRHEEREVREILTAFLSGYKNGVFDKREKKQSKSRWFFSKFE